MNALRRYLRSPEGVAGAIILALLGLAALLAPVLFPADPGTIAGPALVPPFRDWSLPLGTDRLGRDVMAGVFHGARVSLAVGLATAAVAIAVGSIIGVIAGFAGGWIDETLMRIAEAFQTVPAFLLALAFVSVVGPSLPIVILAIALAAWPAPARIARAEVMSLRERDFVAANRVIGMSSAEIAFREILPLVLPVVLALSSVIVANAILVKSALSFLGLSDPNSVTWGAMIAEGRTVLRSAPWLSIIPGIALVATVLGIYLASEGAIEASAMRAPLA